MIWSVAIYCRLSREDGDKVESDSIVNQQALLERYVEQQDDLHLVGVYTDDGYTGTNFSRPDFQRMEQDIAQGTINCVIVKDLSRFGRDYIDVGRYLERVFPEQGVRFIALGDNIDSQKSAYDMLLPLKNVFNEQYAKDISQKVRASFKAKQRSGQFIGAFASYGYLKDPANKNRLIIDPVAAAVVQRIFSLYERGMGKVAIAKKLNGDGVPCPSIYKEQMGEKYDNGRRIQSTTYWTYATIHRMLNNQMYAGNMEQGRSERKTVHSKAKQLERDRWIVVKNTHEPIIDKAQWERVQALLKKDTRTLDFEQNVSLFAGFLRCGDCGRAMAKTTRSGASSYSCGSYKRYGAGSCTAHYIPHNTLEQLVLEDINALIGAVHNLADLAEQAMKEGVPKRNLAAERPKLQLGLERVYKLKKRSYEDYAVGLLDKADYARYKADYDKQEAQLKAQLKQLAESNEEMPLLEQPWVKHLLEYQQLAGLDRAVLAEMIEIIRIYEDGRLEIIYKFKVPEGIAS